MRTKLLKIPMFRKMAQLLIPIIQITITLKFKFNITKMKQGILLALAFSISAFSFAQKKELKTAEKAIKSNNFAEAKGALKQAEALMSEMDDKLKAKYYYLNAQALYTNGKGSDADIDASLEN